LRFVPAENRGFVPAGKFIEKPGRPGGGMKGGRGMGPELGRVGRWPPPSVLSTAKCAFKIKKKNKK